MIKKILFLSFTVITFLLILQFSFGTGTQALTIIGVVYDSVTGAKITNANVTAIIKETGDKSTSNVTNGVFNFNLTSNSIDMLAKSFTVGLLINTTTQMGYDYMIIGSGVGLTLTQSCSAKQWHFNGTANEPGTGNLITVGNVNVLVKNSVGNIFSNSTGFNSGVWDIYLTPCFVPGELSTFEFTITSNTKTGYFSIRQVAK